MTITFSKNVNSVDTGIFGKKNFSVEVRLKFQKDKWQVICTYVYIVHNDGKQSPVHDSMYTREWLTGVVNEMIEESKTIKDWTFQ